MKKDNEFLVNQKAKLDMGSKRRQEFPEEVTALETFLQQTGGKMGGWDQYEHQSFLKVWTKHRGKASYRSEVKLYLPGKTEEDIRSHEDWYLKMCHLQEKKKEVQVHTEPSVRIMLGKLFYIFSLGCLKISSKFLWLDKVEKTVYI